MRRGGGWARRTRELAGAAALAVMGAVLRGAPERVQVRPPARADRALRVPLLRVSIGPTAVRTRRAYGAAGASRAAGAAGERSAAYAASSACSERSQVRCFARSWAAAASWA